MTQEQKEFLLKDLCARLPYGVKFKSENIETALFVDTSDDEVWINGTCIDDFKPYLFPLSSMTDEQKREVSDRWGINENFNFGIDPDWGKYFVELSDALGFINWCYENHIDINGLIPKDLSLDATGLNIY